MPFIRGWERRIRMRNGAPSGSDESITRRSTEIRFTTMRSVAEAVLCAGNDTYPALSRTRPSQNAKLKSRSTIKSA